MFTIVLRLKAVNSFVQTCRYVSSEVTLDNADCTGCQCQPGSEPTRDGTYLLVSICITFCAQVY